MAEAPPPAERAFTTAVDLETEEGRTFLQERLALFAKVGFFLSLGFYSIANLSYLLVAPASEFAAGWRARPNALNLAPAAILLATWLACRRGTLSRRLLEAIDAGLIVGMCTVPALHILLGHRLPVHAYTMLLFVTNILMARALYIPSAPRRTLWVSLAAVAPSLPAAHLYQLSRPPETGAVRGVPLFVVEATLWYACAVATSTIASWLIFDLRRKIREARQLGQYTLEEKLGEGGMGIVYRARHAMLRRPTAVKLLPREKAGEQTVSRFEREVQLTAQLSHPNTVAIYDYGRTPDGIFYYAMELLDGINLERLVREFGPLSPARAVHLLRQVAGALGEAHAVGLVHRDVKPANIILCQRGGMADVAKVVDFGLVKELASGSDAALTGIDVVAGTPLYLAPECITDPATVDGRSDLYSLGAVGYYLITGSNVFEGGTLIEVFSHHLHTPPRPPSERLGRPVPASLEGLILGCLAKDPAQRPQTAQALSEQLLACRDVGEWSAAEASDWWVAHQESLPRLQPEAAGRADSRVATLTMTLDHR